ncbi:MAG TPA: ribonuclease J [Patescibacteria group bacterium]|nr:ribonuclease J [Patescibacteria group bacterium]
MKFTNIEKTKQNVDSDQRALKIITLSGTESVTKNMTIYEYGNDIIAVDCGIGFPDSEMLGVDVVIPDMTYLIENSHRFKGLLITHAHEDHIGAVPYLLQQVNVPIYANKLVQGLLKEKLKEKRFRGIGENVSFHLISSETEETEIGVFKIKGFRLNHSVPEALGFAIKTPEGTIMHMADYKIDWTPVLDAPIDLGVIAEYGRNGVLCLLSDCLGSTTEGYSKSESTLNDTFQDLFEVAEGRQILVTTISSNISRMYQIINAALKLRRKVVMSGRSIDQSVRVARDLGYLPFDEDVFVTENEASSHAQKELVYIIAGCYGQQGSSLDRLSRGENEQITLENNAMVVFSADPNPPGVAEDVERVMDNLTLKGAEVIYSKIQENLHVSGHGTRGDLITIASVVRPKYFIPIGGTVTKARAYTNMVADLGWSHEAVFELLEGESVEFRGGSAKKGARLTVKPVFVDGSTVGEVTQIVVKDREQLSSEGVFVVVVPMQEGKILRGKVEVITRGFIYVKESKELMGKSKDVVNKILDKNGEKVDDWGNLKRRIENDVERFLFKATGRRPLIIVHSMSV